MPQTLGQRILAAQELAAAAVRAKSLAEAAVHDEEALLLMLNTRHFFDVAFRLFEQRLLNGVVPGVVHLGGKTFRDVAFQLRTFSWRIPNTATWREGVGVWSPVHPAHDIWLEFEARCAAQGIQPKWSYDHDGVGIESWYSLTVEPV